MIYDCFTFFNELELLEIRLHTLSPVVDRFVLVEAVYTHQGNPKPLYFEENKARFAPFLHKIIHIVDDKIPDEYYQKEDKTWFLENLQRNAISKGLSMANPEDKILVSDLDEIPYPKSILEAASKQKVVFFGLKHYAYFLNGRIHEKHKTLYLFKLKFLSWFSFSYKRKYFRATNLLGPYMVSFKDIISPQHWRNQRDNLKKEYLLMPLSGWHFSYLGGTQRILDKLKSINIEFDYTPYANADRISQLIANKKDIFDENRFIEIEPIENDFPTYILENKQKFKTFILEK